MIIVGTFRILCRFYFFSLKWHLLGLHAGKNLEGSLDETWSNLYLRKGQKKNNNI